MLSSSYLPVVDRRWVVILDAGRTFRHLQFDRNGLHLGILLQGILAHLSPDARLLETAEGSGRVEHIEAIDPYRPRLDVVRDRVGFTDVSRPDCGCKAIGGVVRALDYFIEVAKFDDTHNRPEDLLPRDL